ncbi:MAG: hypothetical protein KGR24_08575 [Planctomycetes bacterium]|nr:hypothetical protein [Planctomycetota bacterium]
MRSEAWRVVLTGLSLTCVTGTALFLMMAVNPKDAATFGSSPLVYAGGSAALAIAFNRASAWLARRAPSAGEPV